MYLSAIKSLTKWVKYIGKLRCLINFSQRMLAKLSALAKWPCLTEVDTNLLLIGPSYAVIDTVQTAVWLFKVVCQTLPWSCVIGQDLSPSLHSCMKNFTKQQQWINCSRSESFVRQIPLLCTQHLVAPQHYQILFSSQWNHSLIDPTLN